MSPDEDSFLVKAASEDIARKKTSSLWRCNIILEEGHKEGLFLNRNAKMLQDRIRVLYKAKH